MRFLLQLGNGAVTYMDGKPKKQFKPDSVKVVVSFAKIHTESEAWSFASKHPREAIRKLLDLRKTISFLDVSQPTRPAGATASLQAIVFMPANSLIPALRASGVDGVFVRPFIENDQDRCCIEPFLSHWILHCKPHFDNRTSLARRLLVWCLLLAGLVFA